MGCPIIKYVFSLIDNWRLSDTMVIEPDRSHRKRVKPRAQFKIEQELRQAGFAMNKEEAKSDILREAGRNGNQVCKLKNPAGEFVKVKRGYNQPDELRFAYLDALNELLTDGSVKPVFSNRVLDLYELNGVQLEVASLNSVKRRLLSEFAKLGRVYKIHSNGGEFVQCGSQSHDELEDDRILYMEALGELLHHGALCVAKESPEMTVYELAPVASADFVQYITDTPKAKLKVTC